LLLSFSDCEGCARTQAVYHPQRGTGRVIGMLEPFLSIWRNWSIYHKQMSMDSWAISMQLCPAWTLSQSPSCTTVPVSWH